MNTGQTAASSKRYALVLLDSTTAMALTDRVAALQRDGAIIKIVNYVNHRHLMSQVEAIRQILHEHQLDFVLFSRNDQVFDKVSIGPLIRALRVGYSSFSGIDSAQALEQAGVCLDDYLASGSKLALTDRTCTPRAPNGQAGTFSLIFDLEQLGGARFGLPRILKLLDLYSTTATFFVTSFIQEVYGDVLDIILRRGHEVGLHGQYHEYLAGRPLHQQVAMIRQMKCDFGPAEPVSGANFIGRMDADTVNAMIATDLDYFVMFMHHNYRPFGYRKMPLRPLLIWLPQGTIWMVPVSVDNYNRPWFNVKNMIDSAVIAGRTEGWPHVNILLHPFCDGSLRHIGDLERLLNYMQGTLGYKAISIASVVKQLPKYEPSSFVYYGLDDVWRKPVNKHFWQAWWHHKPRYQQRIGNLYQALARDGRQPALCLSLPDTGIVCGVYPHLPEGVTQVNVIEDDPLLFAQNAHSASFDFATANDDQTLALCAFVPSSYRNDLTNAARTLRPRFQQDYTGLLPEAALRVVYRLSRGRHIF